MKPRDYQTAAVNKMFADLKSDPKCRPVIEIPTGGGKSVVIAYALSVLHEAKYRVIVLCRTKELVEQNHRRFSEFYPNLAHYAGVYCAGLGRKETDKAFIFATAQSVAKNVEKFGVRNLVLVDECHQVPDREDSQYQSIMAGLRNANASVRLAGMTATPYRVDGGYLVGEDKTFNKLSYSKPLREMIEEKHLTPIHHVDVNKVDLSKVAIVRGDFDPRQMSGAFAQHAAIHASEVFGYAEKHGLNSCLVFTSSVAHAEIVRECLQDLSGDMVGIVHGETPPSLRDETIQRFKDEDIRFCVNVNVLTTGFDAANIDMIVLLRATCSHSLYYQMIGRGMRLFPAKDSCHVLDYGGHVGRLGDVTGDDFGKDAEPAEVDEPSDIEPREFEPMPRTCKKCGHARGRADIIKQITKVRKTLWPEGVGLFNECRMFDERATSMAEDIATNGSASWPAELADAGKMLQDELSRCPKVECQWAYSAQVLETKELPASDNHEKTEKVTWEVMKLTTSRHISKAGNSSLKVNYHCSKDGSFRVFTDYIGFDGHAGFAKKKWRQLSLTTFPENTEDAVTMSMAGAIGVPDTVSVWKEKGWDRVEPTGKFFKPQDKDLIYEE